MKKQFWVKVRRLIEAGWTKNFYALDKYGVNCEILDPKACKFCLVGAINKTGIEMEMFKDIDDMKAKFVKVVGCISVISVWNDSDQRKKEHVLAALDKVIEVSDD